LLLTTLPENTALPTEPSTKTFKPLDRVPMDSVEMFANAVIFDHPQRSKWAMAAAAVGLVPHGIAIVLRWVAAGHGPYMLKYEVLSSNTWIAVAVLLIFLLRRPAWNALALVVMPVGILMVGIGVFSNPEMRDLPPTLRSIWLVVHISFAKLSAAAFLLSVASSVILLLKGRGHHGAWLDKTPEEAALDAYTVRFIGFGFIFWTVTIIAGAIWANESWGRYWGWDVIETWSLVTWLCYGTFLHVRLFFKVKGSGAAWWAIGCFAVFILTLLILPFLMPSLHSAYFQ
jgi:cytochrome c-type biogenesis protein CcsB